MKTTKTNRTRIIGLRLTPEEFDQIEKKWKISTSHKLSDFVRRHLFEMPIVNTYRNQSLDELIRECSQLRTELNHIGNNFNQAVHKLHTLDHIPQFKSWLLAYEIEKKTLFNKIDEVKNHVAKISESWLLK